MADVKWIKLTTDIFDDEKMAMIEALPNADSIIVIWFKLLVLAGKSNNNGVFMMNNRIAYTDEMLAAIFRRDDKMVKLALSTFEQFGMIEIIDNVITIPNWDKHQSLDAYEKKKERDRKLQAERRARQKALIEKSSDNRLTSGEHSDDGQLTVVVTEVDKEKEEEKEILTTTTTTETHACEDKIPLVLEVARYFENTDPRFNTKAEAYAEATKFHAYNSMMGWKCLPDWQKAADLWLARIDDKR